MAQTTLYMDKLVHEAQARFEEKFDAARKGEAVNLTGHYADKSYNLRAQAANQPLLSQDAHFMSMVGDIEKYSGADYTVRGDVEKRLYSMLAGLLKGLLRECVSSSSDMCKINIEKAWNWYKDKKKDLLDERLRRRDPAQGARGADDRPPVGAPHVAVARARGGDMAPDAAGGDAAARADGAQRADGTPLQGPAGAPAGSGAARQVARVTQHPRYHDLKSPSGAAAHRKLSLDFIDKAKEAQRGTNRTKKLEGHLDNLRYRMQNRDAGGPTGGGKVIRTADGAEVKAVERSREGGESEQPEGPPVRLPQGERKYVPVVPGEDFFSKERVDEGRIPVIPPPPPAAPQYPRVVYKRDRPGGTSSKGPPTFLHSQFSVAPQKDDKEETVKKDVAKLLNDWQSTTYEDGGVMKERDCEWNRIRRQWTSGDGSDVAARLEPLEQVLANTQKQWVANRAKDVERALEEKEFKDTMMLWALNHARVEEEIHRRQESATAASQTGRTHHMILAAGRPRSAQGASLRAADLEGAARPASAEPRSTPLAAASGGPSHPLAHSSAADLAPAELGPNEVYGHRPRESSPGGPLSLSAYDHLLPTRFERIMQKRDERAALATHNDAQRAVLERHGVKPPHDDCLRGTSALNVPLDIVADADTRFVPFPLEGRPPDCKAVKPAKRGGKGSKGKKAPPKKPAGGDEGAPKLSKQDKQDKKWLMQHFFPVKTWNTWDRDEKKTEEWRGGLALGRCDDVASLRRLQQLQMVQRIRDCFARHGAQVPLSEIEAGIITPEDRPFEECVANLPHPSDGLVRDWEKSKGGGGKKKKGGKKGSGKKKKKK